MSEKCRSCENKKKCGCCWFRSLEPISKRPAISIKAIASASQSGTASEDKVIPYVQKLLLPLEVRANTLRGEIDEIRNLLKFREDELSNEIDNIKELRDWRIPDEILQVIQSKSTKPRLDSTLVSCDSSGLLEQARNEKTYCEDEDADRDDNEVEEEEQEEFAPLQPEDPLDPPEGQNSHVFYILNQAMAVLRRQQDMVTEEARKDLKLEGHQIIAEKDKDKDAVDQSIRQAAKKMSLLDRCFFNVRDYMLPLVEALPTSREAREKLKEEYRRNAAEYQKGSNTSDQRPAQLRAPSIIAGGSTQMGKTMFVVVGYVAAWFAKSPLVCITTTVGGTKSLHRKVMDNVRKLEVCGAAGISYYCMYLSSATADQVEYFKDEREMSIGDLDRNLSWHVMAGLGASRKEEWQDRGIVFIADTAAQMKRIVRHITAVREGTLGAGCFGLVVDEADSMQRTGDERLQLEQRLRDLKGIGDGWSEKTSLSVEQRYGGGGFDGPLVTVSISATLLPVLLKMYKLAQKDSTVENPGHERKDPKLYTFFTKAPPSKYVGVLSAVWQPFRREGKPVFLKKSECTGQNLGGILKGNWRDPGAQLDLESNVLALFEDACKMKYSLLLDISVSRVNIEGASLKDKAERLGDHFKNKNLTVITVDGKLIRYKLPRAEWTDDCWVSGISKRAETVEELLNKLEPKINGGPVAIFGYSQMIRGDSFRSELRVPTHMLVRFSCTMVRWTSILISLNVQAPAAQQCNVCRSACSECWTSVVYRERIA